MCVLIRYINIKVGRPIVNVDHATRMLTPHECRLSDQTYVVFFLKNNEFHDKEKIPHQKGDGYAAPIMVDVEYTTANQATKNPEVKTLASLVIGRMPIMLRSSRCVLSGKDDVELSKLGECPLDPGGYFIVKGSEKVILIQEQLYKNHIIIDTRSNSIRIISSLTLMLRDGTFTIIIITLIRVATSVTSSTHETESKTIFFMDKRKIYLQLNQFNKPVIPIMVILKAMGMESDQEIVQMVGRDPRYGDLLFPSIQTSLAMVILRDVFLAHVPLYEGNFRPRWIYAVVMLRCMLDAILNTDTFDDKDYLGNKRLELSGQMISWLFEDLFKSMNTRVLEIVNRAYEKASCSTHVDFIPFIRRNHDITLGFERSISTGNWDLKRFKMHRKGVSQVVSRLSYIAVLGHMTRISPQFEKTRKASGPRALHPSQWGMLCPCDTPEGEGCGLTKNLALLAHITTDEENGRLISLCYTLGVEDLALLSGEELHLPGSFLVMFNGLILGKHRQPKLFADNMRKLRRRGRIGEFVSIFVNEVQHCVYIASDSGRVCRPLVIADRGISRIKDCHMKELQLGIRTFDDFLRDGLVEYLDVNEENNALIALHECENNMDDPEKKKGDITHIEIEPLAIFGVCAGLIPYPHHNHSLYSTYQCAMGKQAMGNIAYNQLYRADTLLNLLVYPQRPLLTTTTIELVGYDKLGAGQNAIVAVMSYSGYDIGGAIVMNKSSLDRGFGRCIVMKKYSVIKEIYGKDTIDRTVKPRKDKPSMQILDDDGIAAPGEIIRNNDIYVNKKTPINTRERTDDRTGLKDEEYRKTPAVYKGPEGETSVVDRVILYSDTNNKLCIKCIIRHTRRPEIGDKFSSRHGQKGVCGVIVQQEDLPFLERGVCPDLIINPHEFIRYELYSILVFAINSGMTLGKMFELIGGKAGVSCGRFHYGDAFEEPSVHADKVEDISNTLAKHGFSYSGKDFLYSGLRLGEMERDCLIAHGVSMVIFERLMLSSDPYEVQVCRQCGLLGRNGTELEAKVGRVELVDLISSDARRGTAAKRGGIVVRAVPLAGQPTGPLSGATSNHAADPSGATVPEASPTELLPTSEGPEEEEELLRTRRKTHRLILSAQALEEPSSPMHVPSPDRVPTLEETQVQSSERTLFVRPSTSTLPSNSSLQVATSQLTESTANITLRPTTLPSTDQPGTSAPMRQRELYKFSALYDLLFTPISTSLPFTPLSSGGGTVTGFSNGSLGGYHE
ncbi:hypothetical protein ZIOFF_066043 [Zingiber officinale]|uniref:DNA-directed RNA polymerase subunit beta n=1 Tax=Zingiber officinale TaxID=94328 RepID=A0A8J5EZ09_ZINOF|nr:hypothetical protein ZIOFF_066043 [Zingiber officinale]